jgi:hypothetical protein
VGRAALRGARVRVRRPPRAARGSLVASARARGRARGRRFRLRHGFALDGETRGSATSWGGSGSASRRPPSSPSSCSRSARSRRSRR